MKEIRAVVRPARVAQLQEALRAVPGFPGLTIVRAEGFTAPAAIEHETLREDLAVFSAKVMLSVLAEDADVPRIREAIFAACSTGQIGDGLVWVVEVAEAHRIRDGMTWRPPRAPDGDGGGDGGGDIDGRA